MGNKNIVEWRAGDERREGKKWSWVLGVGGIIVGALSLALAKEQAVCLSGIPLALLMGYTGYAINKVTNERTAGMENDQVLSRYPEE